VRERQRAVAAKVLVYQGLMKTNMKLQRKELQRQAVKFISEKNQGTRQGGGRCWSKSGQHEQGLAVSFKVRAASSPPSWMGRYYYLEVAPMDWLRRSWALAEVLVTSTALACLNQVTYQSSSNVLVGLWAPLEPHKHTAHCMCIHKRQEGPWPPRCCAASVLSVFAVQPDSMA
jgi:hypothetical protein